MFAGVVQDLSVIGDGSAITVASNQDEVEIWKEGLWTRYYLVYKPIGASPGRDNMVWY